MKTKKACLFLAFFFLIINIPALGAVTFAGVNNDTNTAASDKYKSKIVKVGIIDFLFFSEKQEDGTYQGIICDYLKEIAKYSGWDIEYVETTPEKGLELLVNGDIDIMGGVLKTEETAQNMDFAEYNSGYSYSTLTVKRSNNYYIQMDYSTFNEMRVGVLSTATKRLNSLNSFCESNDISLTPVFFDSQKEMDVAFENDEIDALLTNDSNLKEDQKIVAKFAAVPYYFAVTRGKTDILRELNATLLNLIEINPQFDNMLYEKYFVDSANPEFHLTEEEKEYVKNSQPLKVATYTKMAPIEFQNKNGNPSGISIDMLETLKKITGLQFEYLHADNYQNALHMVRDGKADLISSVYDNTLSNADTDLTLTNSYLSTPTVMVRNSNSSDNSPNIVALPYGIAYSSIDSSDTVQYYQNVEECLKAVISQKADYTVANSLIIDHYMHLRGNNKLNLIPISGFMGNLTLGLAKPTDPKLLSILDKAIASVSQADVQTSVIKNTSMGSYKITLDYLIYTNPILFLAIIIGISFVIMTAIVFIMRMRLHLSQQKALSGEAYRIIGELSDEYILEYDFESNELRLPMEFAQLIGRENIVLMGKSAAADGNLRTLLSLFDTKSPQDRNTAEFKFKLSNGKEEWFRAVGTVLFNAQQKPTRGIGKLVNIQAEVQEKMQLENRANHDTITGIYNKQYCIQALSSFFTQRVQHKKGALLIIDLDFFKLVNDTLGHLAGDEVLKDLALVLTKNFGHDSIIGRWGGDEFIVFIEEVTDEGDVINRVKDLCNKMNKVFHYEGKSHIISISVGVSFTDENSSYDQLFHHADAALYAVKNGCRNGMQVYVKSG